MSVKYSILLPTRNGIQYLPFAIASVLNQSEQNFELIVSDNHSNDETWNYLITLNDSRLVCIKPLEPLSMINHFEFIIQKAKGDWISIIGDDDGLQPYFFELCNKLIKEKGDLYDVISSKRAYYFWKGSEVKYNNKVVHYQAHNQAEQVTTRKAFYDLLFSKNQYFEFPQFYTGTLFRKELLNRVIKKQKGRVYNSITPDAESLVIILKNCKNYLYMHISLAWVGTSVKSTGFSAAATQKSEKTSKEDFTKLNAKDNVSINSKFPFLIEIFDMHLIFLEALYQNNFLYKPLIFKLLDTWVGKHLLFLKSYKNYRARKTQSKQIAYQYKEVFKAHNLSIFFLKFIFILNKVWGLCISLLNKIKNKFLVLFNKNKTKNVSFHSQSREEFPDLLSASKKSLELYKELTA